MKENKVIVVTLIINLGVAVLKLVSGIIFSFSTLISDSVQSFADVVTDILSLIVNRIGKRRANKTYPFGYGQVYYLANLFTGLLLFLIGAFITYRFFFFEGKMEPTISLFIVLVVVLILKMIVVRLLKYYGKIYKSESMIEAAKESNADFVSTCVVLGISLLVILSSKIGINIDFDKIGCLGMAIYVYYIAITMIIANIKGILINTEENKELESKIEEQLSKYENIDLKSLKVINMSKYYSVFIQIKVKKNISINKYIMLENKIKRSIKLKNKEIRFVDIEPIN